MWIILCGRWLGDFKTSTSRSCEMWYGGPCAKSMHDTGLCDAWCGSAACTLSHPSPPCKTRSRHCHCHCHHQAATATATITLPLPLPPSPSYTITSHQEQQRAAHGDTGQGLPCATGRIQRLPSIILGATQTIQTFREGRTAADQAAALHQCTYGGHNLVIIVKNAMETGPVLGHHLAVREGRRK